MATKMKCRVVSFKEVYGMVLKLSDEIKTSGYKPTTIIGLARGGWIPARLICDFLGITDLISLKIEHWIQTGKTKDKATIRYPITANLQKKKVLIVDDITDTGESLTTSLEYLKGFNPEDIQVATMQYIPHSKHKPNYFAEEVKVWTWFIYPWNWIEDTSTLISRLMETLKEKEWFTNHIDKGLKDFFEIEWDDTMLKRVLEVMVEREQIEVVRNRMNIAYRLKEGKVIEL